MLLAIKILGVWCVVGILSYLLILRFFPTTPLIAEDVDGDLLADGEKRSRRVELGPIARSLDRLLTAIAVPVTVVGMLLLSPLLLVAFLARMLWKR